MSTLELEHLKHTSSSSNNLSVHSDGSLTLGAVPSLTVDNGTSHANIIAKGGNATTNYSGASILLANPGMDTNYGGTYLYHHKAGGSGNQNAAFNISQRTAAGAYVSNIWNVDYQNNAHSFYVPNGGASGASVLGIDGGGNVTKPYQACWFYAGGTSLTAGSYVVTKPGTAYISSPHYNTSTGLFTAPITGKYLVGVEGLVYPHSGNVMTNRWQKNGGQYGHIIQSGGENNSHTHLSWTQLVDLAQNDTIGFAINRSGSSENAYGSQWHQWGYLLG